VRGDGGAGEGLMLINTFILDQVMYCIASNFEGFRCFEEALLFKYKFPHPVVL